MMRLFQLVLISSALAVTLIAGAVGVSIPLARQTTEPLQISLPLNRTHQATFYVGYDPGLSCIVGEERALGLSIVDTTSRQSTRLIAIPLGP